MVVSHHELCVHQNVPTENERNDDAVCEIDLLVVREEHGHEAKDDDQPQSAKEVRDPARKVILCLAGEQRQDDEDSEREDERLNDDLLLIERGNDRDAVSFESSEDTEENEVGRV